jgi:hypothetical protein
MYALNSRGYDTVSTETLPDLRRVLEVHRSCYGLGQVAVIVINVSLFLERVDRAVRTTTDLRGSCRGLVDYFDDAHHHGPFESKLGFHKRKQYEKQREYRILVRSSRSERGPYRLKVGDLSDIVRVTTPDELNRSLELKLPDGSRG